MLGWHKGVLFFEWFYHKRRAKLSTLAVSVDVNDLLGEKELDSPRMLAQH